MGTIYDHNLKVYSDQTICNSYIDCNELQVPELKILDLIANEINDKKILDIGIGTGRTTKHLLQYSKDYIGIDYSAGMVQKAKERFKEAQILQMDARNLHAFDSQSFDFILFSFNGIDYMNHEDRIKCLGEIVRTLKNGGFFVFSSHNREYENFNRFVIKAPLFSVPYFKRLAKGGSNRLKNVLKHVYTESYAIITDPGHDYDCLTYYINPQQQAKQLEEHGFHNIQMFGLDGKAINSVADKKSAWIYYLANK
jgi:ubiquinone/menaquinone biosynthesis C-methylase UbiE